ncbi:cytochrome d ubiquinol oxidase subunit II [Zooshikella ganghwensis]|uniref:Cytochrome d ubiquinol oxidase subunit II n=1 Tax=Zooshikella ganghwensis TaxID=202772 RepID=A0A4P9VN96_9GAMM|nr:cytochrome d ubiquinol oxidase subunit II [Zooshikella ganghwensis]RDH43897.1 cytochrome d ubiquinol oxidase subunit II [Zooshikella ganghwensis]
MDWAIVWFLLLGFGVFMYVVLDGFDLGLGILYPWYQPDERLLMMNSIKHIWDGNETWLVLGGVLLFAAFPPAYSLVLSHLYLPVMIMLWALIFRGVAFEYRFKATTSKHWWDFAFFAGSSIATFCQGLMLGVLLQGLTLEEGQLTISSWSWLTPFSVFTGFALMEGYALLGSLWLVWKTSGAIQQHSRKLAIMLLVIIAVLLCVVSGWSTLLDARIMDRWFSFPNMLWLAPLPLLTGYALWRAWCGLKQPSEREWLPFAWVIAVFGLSFIGLVVSVFPFLIPWQLTIWEAIAPAKSLNFILPGVLVLVPVILAYTLFGYKVFSGKLDTLDGGY